ncbi:endonuclease-reverse transcriptase [Elysia marginata]|uniref:Endonuclease-reverse transcriptase n=1 Tax=Elysia marginata TaxID=1093978 RepID=A0AAV4HT47_9GAST|nr:endonuclease-reverse transcriptase [Elysia marginata]
MGAGSRFRVPINREAKQEWITEDILDMMKERKRLKGSDAYKHIDNNIKMASKTAKEEWLNSKCDEIELLSQRNDLTAMLQKIKSFQPKQTVTASCIKGKDGGILFEIEKIVLRWTEYVEELFSDQRCAKLIQEHLQGPEVLRNEVEKCLKDMKYGKAAGIDNISCEMLKALGDFEYIFREIDDVPGLKVNGGNINNLRYADDTVLLAESENDLQNLVTIIEEKSEQYGLMMNTKKTKAMVISKKEPPKVHIKVKGKCIEHIEQFKYLGQLITTDARSDDEIKSRITITKSAFTKLSHIHVLTSKRVGLLTRLRVMKCFVWSPFLYAGETWTLNKNTQKRIEAMEFGNVDL